METSRVVEKIKARLQAQQVGIWSAGGDVEGMVRLNVRAEFDALWAVVEVLAQTIDGVDAVTVPDYFADRS